MNTITGLKKDFPIFVHAKNLVYLDNAATTHKPITMINEISQFYSTYNATVHRALYPMGEEATSNYEDTRTTVARFINAKYTEEIVFTKGATEGVNFIATAWALSHLKPGDEIVLTQAEHHANLLPWQEVAKITGATLTMIPISTVTYQLIDPLSYISPRTKLLAITQSSNVLGSIWNETAHELEVCIAKAQQFGARVLIDAAQTVAHHKLDVQALGADFLVFSGHKMFAPSGIGVLYISKNCHDEVEPYHYGGSMVHEAQFTSATWAQSPRKYEAGTPPIAAVLGLGATIKYLMQQVDYTNLEKHEAFLCSQLIDGLEQLEGISIVGNKEILRRKGHVVSISLGAFHPHDIAMYLGSRGIAVRAGHFCAQPLVTMLGHESLMRVSLALYNTTDDIKTFLQELESALNLFKNALL